MVELKCSGSSEKALSQPSWVRGKRAGRGGRSALDWKLASRREDGLDGHDSTPCRA